VISAHLESAHFLLLQLILLAELGVEVRRLGRLEGYWLGDLALLNCFLVILVDDWGMSIAPQLLVVLLQEAWFFLFVFNAAPCEEVPLRLVLYRVGAGVGHVGYLGEGLLLVRGVRIQGWILGTELLHRGLGSIPLEVGWKIGRGCWDLGRVLELALGERGLLVGVELLEVGLVSGLDFDMMLHVGHAPLEVKASLSAQLIGGVLWVRCVGRSTRGHLVLLHVLIIAQLLVVFKVV
jgi:hypothetical protein